MKKFLSLILSVATVFLLCGCTDTYRFFSNDVNNYEVYSVVLESGQKKEFDIYEIFKNCGFKIDKFEIVQSPNGIYKAEGNTVTAVKCGVSDVKVNLYNKETSTAFQANLCRLYSFDQSKMTPIRTVSDLQNINNNKDGVYVLKADIDLASVKNWEPLGNHPAGNEFSGMFVNPDGYTIKNLTISTSKEIFNGPYGGCAGGLFGSLKNALVYGVKMENVNIDVSDFDGINSSSAGGITSSMLDSMIKDCTVSGNIAATGTAGGIVGSNSWGTVENCVFNGEVSCVYSEEKEYYEMCAGGIAGYSGNPDWLLSRKGGIFGCKANAKINSPGCVGGITGCVYGKHSIKNCLFKGELDENAEYRAEIFGYSNDPEGYND